MTGTPVNLEEIDVFELALLRGTTVSGLKELKSDFNARLEAQQENLKLTGQKHTKKDYEKLKSMNLNDVVRLTKEERRVQNFEDQSLDTVVKVEKKKNFKRRPKQEQLDKDREIQKLLDTPQDINYEKAMALYEEQPLEAKELT